MAFEIQPPLGISEKRDSFDQNAGKDERKIWPKAFGKPPVSYGRKEGILKRLGNLKINPS